jgi:hypothetical protein
MSDSDLFGVQNPETGEIGYCCVMGAGGEVFALAVYLGWEGLIGYLAIQSGEINVDDPDVMHLQKCLMASFEDRDDLENEDLKIIRRLGLRFRGRKAWPQFRSFLPGYVPWYLTKEEASFLTVALEQAAEVALRFREDRNLLSPSEEGLFFTRVLLNKDGAPTWQDAWTEPVENEGRERLTPPVDELRIKRMKKNRANKKGICWEIDAFYFPGAVEEGERPYFPRISVVADHTSALVLHFWLEAPRSYVTRFHDNLLSFFEDSKMLPEKIFVHDPEVFELLEPITSPLNIELKSVESLSAVEELRADMLSRFFDVPGDFIP